MLEHALRIDVASRQTAAIRILSTIIFVVSALLILPCLMNADEAYAYSISGTVTNNTSTPGRVYVSLDLPGGGSTGLGVSMLVDGNSSALYTINGLFTRGSYVVSAFLDTTASGFQYANSPAGATSLFSFNNSNLTGKNVTLSSPSPVGLSGI